MPSRSTHFPTMLDPFIIRCRGSDTVAVDQATGIKMTRGRHTGSYLARSTMECDGSHGGCLRSDRIFHLLLISMIQESLTLHVLRMNNEPISTGDCLFADLIRLERSIWREDVTIYEVLWTWYVLWKFIYLFFFFICIRDAFSPLYKWKMYIEWFIPDWKLKFIFEIVCNSIDCDPFFFVNNECREYYLFVTITI